jgi:hypothetical protein
MRKLQKHGNGIVLMHDFQHGTAEALRLVHLVCRRTTPDPLSMWRAPSESSTQSGDYGFSTEPD